MYIDKKYLVKPYYTWNEDSRIPEKLYTIWGTAQITNRGYLRITSDEKDCFGKLVHRLIYEAEHELTLSPGFVVHHIDGDKLNDDITNLELMSNEEHTSLHHKSKLIPEETKIKMSKASNTTGFFGVDKRKKNDVKQGFTYRYRFYDENQNRISIESVDICKLRDKVLSKGLEWRVIDEEKAKRTLEENKNDAINGNTLDDFL